MDGERTVKKVLEDKPGGERETEREKERPTLRRMDDVKLDVRNMGMKKGEQVLWTEQNGNL
jgi:hypothetical protein